MIKFFSCDSDLKYNLILGPMDNEGNTCILHNIYTFPFNKILYFMSVWLPCSYPLGAYFC